jgi:hypothetical protein
MLPLCELLSRRRAPDVVDVLLTDHTTHRSPHAHRSPHTDHHTNHTTHRSHHTQITPHTNHTTHRSHHTDHTSHRSHHTQITYTTQAHTDHTTHKSHLVQLQVRHFCVLFCVFCRLFCVFCRLLLCLPPLLLPSSSGADVAAVDARKAVCTRAFVLVRLPSDTLHSEGQHNS